MKVSTMVNRSGIKCNDFERPPTPPIPPKNFRMVATSKAVGKENELDSKRRTPRTPRMGRFVQPITPRSIKQSMESIDGRNLQNHGISSSGTPGERGRPLFRRSRCGLRSLSTSPDFRSPSISPSRSATPTFDRRRRSNMLLNGKGPHTPVLEFMRQSSYVKQKVIVGIRLRPFIPEDCPNDSGKLKSAVAVKTENSSAVVNVQSKTGSLVFEFDHGFAADENVRNYDSDQKMVYEKLAQPLVESMIAGFNCSFFAYGQTGTGKTFSTHGKKEHPGVVPRFCRDFLDSISLSNEKETWKLEISYFEVYNEMINDLLVSKGPQFKLRVREHPEDGPFIENLTSIQVSKYEDIEKWLDFGNNVRSTAATSRNDGSSRSHAVFLLKLFQMTAVDGRPVLRKSKASFVDLAGSERLDATSSSMSNADRMIETKNINKSLASLANVILQLADGKRRHISYRDSVLTWLLKDSLGGNAKTVMLATVAPSMANVDETLSTLRYAAKAYRIYNKAYVNEDPAIGYIEQLKKENETLKTLLAAGGHVVEDDDRISALKAKIEELELVLEEKDLEINEQRNNEIARNIDVHSRGTQTMADGIISANEYKETEKVFLDSLDKPALISLTESPTIAKENVHVIDTILSIVGKAPNCTVSLKKGSTVLDVQCTVNWRYNRLFLFPRKGTDDVFVNGQRIQDDNNDLKELFDGDLLAVGTEGDYFFRVFIPTCYYGVNNDINIGVLRQNYYQARAQLLQLKYQRATAELNISHTVRDGLLRQLHDERERQDDLMTEIREQYKAIFREEFERARHLSSALQELVERTDAINHGDGDFDNPMEDHP